MFNLYRHWNMYYMHGDPGKPAIIVFLKEGTLQSNVFGAMIYAIGLMPLAEQMPTEVLRALQP